MISSYDRRIHIAPHETASLALVTLGNGNNMPGYYMFQGGINPDGKYSTLNENGLPVKDYDFGPLGACGQLREHYHLLRQQHLFLEPVRRNAGRDAAFLSRSTGRPTSTTSPRCVGTCGATDGAVSSSSTTTNASCRCRPKRACNSHSRPRQETLLVPREPITIPAGVYGIWPINLDCAGVTVKYATAQPICSLEADGQSWFFFTAIDGIRPDFVVSDVGRQTRVQNITPDTGVAFTRQSSNGRKVNFIVLTAEQGRQLWKMPLAGRERVVLSPDAILPDSDGRIRFETVRARRACSASR